MTEIIIRDKQVKQKRLLELADINIFKVPSAMVGEGGFQVEIAPKSMYMEFFIDPKAKEWLNNRLTEFALEKNLRSGNKDLARLRFRAIMLLQELYQRGLCEFEDQTAKILS